MPNKYMSLFLAAVIFTLAQPGMAKNDNHPHKHKDKPLPPGLQKNMERGKPLPPGWQKKLYKGAILAPDIVAHGKVIVPLDKHGVITLQIEHRVVRLLHATREIIDILK